MSPFLLTVFMFFFQPIDDFVNEIKILKNKIEFLESSNQNAKITNFDIEKTDAFSKIDAKFAKMQSDHQKCLANTEVLTKNFFSIIEKVDIVERALKLKENDNCALQDLANQKCLLENENFLRKKRESSVIDVECEKSEWTKSEVTFQSCNVKNVKITHPEFVIKNIIVGHRNQAEDGKNLEELKAFNEQIIFLPLKMAESFPNLKVLSLIQCGLSIVNSQALNGLFKLQTLALSRNAINNISNEGFLNIDALINLDLSHNKVESINDEALKSLRELVVLKLNNNILTHLNENMFVNQQKLNFLFLQNNKISRIPSNLLEPLKKLEFVDFNDNNCVKMAASKETAITIKNLKTYFAENCSS